jgi:hypothetical protein
MEELLVIGAFVVLSLLFIGFKKNKSTDNGSTIMYQISRD